MAENSYTESISKSASRYDDLNPNYDNNAYSQMFQGNSAYNNQDKTGFRQVIPQALVDNYADIPEYKIGKLNYTPTKIIPKPQTISPVEQNNESDNNSKQTAIDNTLGYLNDYNNSISTFGSEGMTDANRNNPVANPTDFYGNPISKEINSPTFSPLDFVPGIGLMNTLNSPAVPTSGYGAPGTYSGITGNRFSADSRGINPITGQYKDEYGTKKAFADKIINDPFGNIFGDPDKAEQGKLSDLAYAGHRSELSELGYGATDIMGNPVSVGLSKANEDKVITQLGIDMGFPAHTVAPGTPTHESIKTGRNVKGSQYMPSKKTQEKAKAEQAAKDAAADAAADAAQAQANASVNTSSGYQDTSNNYGNDSNDSGGSTPGDSSGSFGGVGDYSSGGKIPPLTYATEGKYIGQPTGKQTIVGKDIYSSPITGPMGNLVGGKNASEQGTTIKKDNQYGNIPSIYNGMQYNEDQLIQMMKDKEIPKPTAYYDDDKKAVINSIMRSRALDGQNVMGMEHTQRDPFEKIFRSTK